MESQDSGRARQSNVQLSPLLQRHKAFDKNGMSLLSFTVNWLELETHNVVSLSSI